MVNLERQKQVLTRRKHRAASPKKWRPLLIFINTSQNPLRSRVFESKNLTSYVNAPKVKSKRPGSKLNWHTWFPLNFHFHSFSSRKISIYSYVKVVKTERSLKPWALDHFDAICFDLTGANFENRFPFGETIEKEKRATF